MTLIIAAANREFAVLASDRRLTNGEEEANKATIFACADGRFAVAYTGLARLAGFSTEAWLVDELVECGAAGGHQFAQAMERLTAKATEKLDRLRPLLRPGSDRLSIVLLGYGYDGHQPRAISALISNYDGFCGSARATADSRFTLDTVVESPTAERASLVLAIGAEAAVIPDDFSSVRELLRSNDCATAVRDRMVAAIRRAADSPVSENLIGKQINTIVLPADFSRDAQVEYHSAAPTPRAYFPNHVVSTPEWQMATKDGYFGTLDEAGRPVMTIPRVGRNARCPCGSGKRYKRCHGANGPDLTIAVGPP